MKEVELTETEEMARKLYAEGKSFVDMLEKSLYKPSKFTNGLLYSISVVCFEKLMVGLLAYYDVMATHHTPLALFKEAQDIDKGLTEEMKETPRLLNKFESICSLDGFGQKTPTKEELNEIIKGLKTIQVFVETRIFN